MKSIIKFAAVIALIAPTATFAAGVYDFPTFSNSDFPSASSEKAVQPVTKLDTSASTKTVTTIEANTQK